MLRIRHAMVFMLIIALLSAGAAFSIGYIVFSGREEATTKIAEFIRPIRTESVVPAYDQGLYPPSLYEKAYERMGEVTSVRGVRSAITAHHLLVADKIAALFETIGDDQIKTVVLISPNHFSVGKSPAQISIESWQTPYGVLESDKKSIQELLDAIPELQHEEDAFKKEHGISGVTPFLKKTFPNAKFVPIILDESLSGESASVIGHTIAKELPNAVVIASIDMSHNLPMHTQEYHDQVTTMQIENGGEAVDLEIDSNATLRVLSAFNEAAESQAWHQISHTNSLDLTGSDAWRENTSHIMGYFKESAEAGERFASMHFVGDIMLDRGVRKRIDASGTPAYPWREMSRFLNGSHLVVGNLEGTVNEQESTYTYDPPFRFVFDPSYVKEMAKYIDVVSLANNHTRDVGYAGELETREWLDQIGVPYFGSWEEPVPRYDTVINGFDVTFVGYHQFRPALDQLKAEIVRAKSENRYVIVMPHWGVEYVNTPGSNQRELAQEMVNSGADLIIGSHPHVPQGIEVIDDVPVVYSLGNFVFDQEIPATWNALTVGIILTNNSVTLRLMPVNTRFSQPVPLSDSEAQSIFDLVANASPDALRSQLKEGFLTVQYE